LWKNIPFAKPPDSADTRFKPAQNPERQDKIFKDVSDIKCPQAMPGWTTLSNEFITEFTNFGPDPTAPNPPQLSTKWNNRIDPEDYEWPVENTLGGTMIPFTYCEKAVNL
jgi:hypothetical protein